MAARIDRLAEDPRLKIIPATKHIEGEDQNMKSMEKLATVSASIALSMTLLLALNTSAKPAPDNHHQGYMHALADMRVVRYWVSHPDSGSMHDQEKAVVDELDQAIADIKAAGIDDGKGDNAGADTNMRWIARLNKAADMLNKAHDEVLKDQDDGAAQGLQQKTLDHIAKARKNVVAAIALEQ